MEIKKAEIVFVLICVGMCASGAAIGPILMGGNLNTTALISAAIIVCVAFFILGTKNRLTVSIEPQPTKKARSMKKDTSAVSPVIAVILMVAITVVLAATVFVLVSDIGSNPPPPRVTFDKADGNLTVISADLGLTWEEFNVTGCTTVPTGPLDAGDIIIGCTGNVVVRHRASNSLTYQTAF
jgi:flagellin-like protein